MTLTSEPPTARRRATVALAAALSTNALGHAFLLITIPPLGRALGWSDMRSGLLLGVSALLITVAGPFWGMVCDRWGRRRVLLSAFVAAVVFPLALGLIVQARLEGALGAGPAFVLALGARLVQAALSAGVMPGAQAFLADITSPSQRARGMGLMGAAFGVGSVAGGALAWQAGMMHAVLALVVISLVGGIAWAGLWAFLAEPRSRPVGGPASARPGPAGRSSDLPRRLWPYLAITACGLTVYGLIHQVTALRLQDAFGFDGDGALRRSGAMMMLTLGAMVVTQGLLVRWLGWSPGRLLRVGAGIAIAAMAGAAVAPSAVFLTGATVLLGCGLGLTLPGNLALLSLRAGPEAQAWAAGINGVAQGVGMAAGPVVGASLHQVSPVAPYGVAVLVLAVLAILAVRHGTVSFAR